MDITLQDIENAAERIKEYAHKTPVITCQTLNDMAGCRLYFKCEQFQKVGAFKFRGAYNSVMKLSHEEASKGVVTHSSGNHAQALALSAKLRGIKAYIVMPENAPKVKRDAVEKTYGATVITCASNLKAREEACQKVIDETGATLIAPYDNRNVIEGQGTCARELLLEFPDLDGILVPVGGGGLLAGTLLAAKQMKPSIKVIAGEPKGADDCAQSLEAGQLIPQTAPNTIADGLRTSVGHLNFPVIQKYVDKVLTVTEEEIMAAMRLVWERAKLIIEPSSAVPVAVALFHPDFKSWQLGDVGIILSGGNVDLLEWSWHKH